MFFIFLLWGIGWYQKLKKFKKNPNQISSLTDKITFGNKNGKDEQRRHLDFWPRSSAGIDDFPIWVQLLPRVFFNVIVARFEKEKISKAALRSFYSKLNTNLTAAELDRVSLYFEID